MNNVSLVGRITKECDLRKLNDNTSVASFTLAVDGGKSKKGEVITDFIDCSAFGTTADFVATYIHKGYRLAVSGRLHQESWQTQDGSMRSRLVVIADRVENLEPKKEEQPKPSNQAEAMANVGKNFNPPKNEEFEVSPDDLPF